MYDQQRRRVAIIKGAILAFIGVHLRVLLRAVTAWMKGRNKL